jgi:C-terminal processing protease CtpA/Prc
MLRPLSRTIVHSSALLALTVVFAPATSPLAAQQRVYVSTRRTPRADSDSVERVVQRLRVRADSALRVYNDARDLDEQRRAGEVLDQIVEQIGRLRSQLMDADDRQMRAEAARGMWAPLIGEQAAALSEAMRRNVPRGWLGIVVSGAAREPWVEHGELLVRYVTHPEIISVEPSSPAERAGLIPSDTLIAYNGKDVTAGDISITRLVKPNSRVLVRIRRDGRTRDVPVMISNAPPRIVIRVDEMMSEGMPSPLAERPSFPRAPLPPPATASLTPMAPVPPMAVGVFAPASPAPYDMSESGVAGAQLKAIVPGSVFARSLGVRRGVLVVSAPTGSPAAQSGLMDGDVLVKVAGQYVQTVTAVRELVEMAVSRGEHSVPVETLRERKSRRETLRW